MTTDTNISTHTHLFDLPEQLDTYQSVGIFLSAGLTLQDYVQSVLHPLIPTLRRSKGAKPPSHDHLLALVEYMAQLAVLADIRMDWSTILRELTQIRTFVCEKYRSVNPGLDKILVIVWLQEPNVLGLDFVKVRQ